MLLRSSLTCSSSSVTSSLETREISSTTLCCMALHVLFSSLTRRTPIDKSRPTAAGGRAGGRGRGVGGGGVVAQEPQQERQRREKRKCSTSTVKLFREIPAYFHLKGIWICAVQKYLCDWFIILFWNIYIFCCTNGQIPNDDTDTWVALARRGINVARCLIATSRGVAAATRSL